MRKLFLPVSFGVALGVLATLGLQQFQNSFHATSPYAGQDARQISSLSANDIEQLKAGQGWGLAKPAEFNGFPGPAHILELSEKLKLSEAQSQHVKQSFDEMQQRAKQLGEALIEAEASLDAIFIDNTATSETLQQRLSEIEAVRAKLREVHLVAHLEVTPILSDKQRMQYTQLRGYHGDHSGHSGH